ncbi:hypothetical protein AVEN_171764-1 [Araneus ventricosus]|uniref:Uncharacterized protein n=1 Tax=Araneus ventricosus TaxID=182803 RepID=A0A4Y2WPI3_ARAVE|nr:hypothetical protein AVEN_171764-1 [Araneus ventricosus]
MKASLTICAKPVFLSTYFNRKIQARLSLEALKCAGGRVGRRSLLLPPTRQISGFLASKRGPNLVRSFDVPPTLVPGPKLESAHEVLDFDLVRFPASPSRCANFNRILKLTTSCVTRRCTGYHE